MRQKTINVMGYIVNAASIGIFPYLVFKLDVPAPLHPLVIFGWVFLVLGIGLMASSLLALVRNGGGGLIEGGIYGIVRHPMYLGALLCFLSYVFFHPHWITLLISLINGVIVYRFIRQGEKQNIETFGDAYRQYRRAVPQINLFAGITRRLKTGKGRD